MPCENSQTIKKDENLWYAKKATKRGSYVGWTNFYSEYLKPPYRKYLNFFKSLEVKNPEILELCCGMGEFSFDIARITQGKVLAVDISKESIDICNRHLSETGQEGLKFEVADIEKIELPEKKFDVICMSGSLSYLNLDILLNNVKKWLKPEGRLVVVDTYGYSPVFNLKRRLNYLFGKTTKQTVLGIPKEDTIKRIRDCFKQSEVDFFGIFAFIGPFLKYIIGDRNTAKFVDFLDKKFSFLKKHAFKFVLCAKQLRR